MATNPDFRDLLSALYGEGAEFIIDDPATPGTVFQIGIAPNHVDVLTSIESVTFERAWAHKTASTYEGVPIFLLSAEDLLMNKRAVGRQQDLLDVERLERCMRAGD